MNVWKALLVGLLVGAALGTGVTGYIAWRAVSDAKADVAEAHRNLDAARKSQREAEASAARIAQQLQQTRNALRASRDRVDTLERILGESGAELDSLGTGIETAWNASGESAALIAELKEQLERLREPDSEAAP